MKNIAFLIVWLVLGAAMFVLAATQNTIALGVAVVLLGVGGLGTLAFLKHRHPPQRATPDVAARLSQLEERLRLTEEELASAIRELTAFREQHEFDRELLRKPENHETLPEHES